MTFREKLQKEYPEYVNDKCRGLGSHDGHGYEETSCDEKRILKCRRLDCDKCFDKLLQIKDYKRIDDIMWDAVEDFANKYELPEEISVYLSAVDDIRNLMLKNEILKMRDNERH